jgi:hypothetical protein
MIKPLSESSEDSMTSEHFFASILKLIPRLKTKIQITGFAISLVSFLVFHLWMPSSFLSQVLICVLAVMFLFFPLAFIFAEGLEPRDRSIYLTKILIIFAITCFVIVASITTLTLYKFHGEHTSDYAVRITIIDEHGGVVDSSAVHSSVGGEFLKVSGGWEFHISKLALPASGTVVFRASVPDSFLAGSTTLILGDNLHPSVKIRVTHDTTASVRGTVVSNSGSPLKGIKVWVEGYPPVTSDAQGSFLLPAHAADGEFVKLHLASNRRTEFQNVLAGEKAITIPFEDR